MRLFIVAVLLIITLHTQCCAKENGFTFHKS